MSVPKIARGAAPLPHVTAVMVTGKSPARIPMARAAVEAFYEQDYRADLADLLILNDGLAPILEHPRLRTCELRLPPGKALGALRNVAIDLAAGHYLIQWDDDDWHAPQRISQQVAALGAPGRACLLENWTVADLRTGQAAVHLGARRGTGGIEGTILFGRATGVRYPEIGRGEDTVFAERIRDAHGMDSLANDPLLYVHFWHGANTWDRDHILRQGSRPLSAEERKRFDEILKQHRARCGLPTG